MTVNDLLGRINTSNAGVTAYFDSALSRFYLRANSVGSSTISLGGNGDTSNFLTLAGLLTTAGGIQIAGQTRGAVESDLPLAQGGFTQAVTAGVFTINNTKISIDSGVDTLAKFLPCYPAVNKFSALVAIGCTGGKHRSVAFANLLTAHLQGLGFNAGCQHRDIDRL